jgi:hypothetical protein
VSHTRFNPFALAGFGFGRLFIVFTVSLFVRNGHTLQRVFLCTHAGAISLFHQFLPGRITGSLDCFLLFSSSAQQTSGKVLGLTIRRPRHYTKHACKVVFLISQSSMPPSDLGGGRLKPCTVISSIVVFDRIGRLAPVSRRLRTDGFGWTHLWSACFR